MLALRGANLALKFALELVAFAAFAYWGSHLGGVLVGAAALAAAVVLWGRFAAPKASRRLPTGQRVPFELGVFALAAAALFTAGLKAVAIAFAAVVVVNAILLWRLGQLEA